MTIEIHPDIIAELRRLKPTGEPTWRELIEAANRVIEELKNDGRRENESR